MGKAYIKGGTPIGSDSLCKTCSYAHIMTGYRESEMVTMCSEVNPNIVVPFLIYECSSYYDKNRPNWEQMEKLAIDVAPAPMKPVSASAKRLSHPSMTTKTMNDLTCVVTHLRTGFHVAQMGH
jgi:hypothetical protein